MFAEIYAAVRNELFLFAAVFFLLGAIDEWAMDIAYFVMRVTGRANTLRLDEPDLASRRLQGSVAVFVPLWQEAAVIETTLRHASVAWPQSEVRFYVGCYPNDPATREAVLRAAKDDERIRIVLHDRVGPTSKADCLNRLYRALEQDETTSGVKVRFVVLQDAEDCIDPYALALIDRGMDRAEFVQLPVLALPLAGSPFIASHYSDEFAEAHGKAMVVRSALGHGVPGAGVGTAIERGALATLARGQGGRPFAADSLTEDYELGLNIAALGGRSVYLRARTRSGRLIATRSYFPDTIETAVRQKTRWVHGIALQSWDRMGWHGGPGAMWMTLRDRRGPFAALLLAIAYTLIAVTAFDLGAAVLGMHITEPLGPATQIMLVVLLGSVVWRAVMRAAFTTREFGWRQGLTSIARIPVSNIIAIMAGRRAVMAYWRSLKGEAPRWDKTEHRDHPALSHPV